MSPTERKVVRPGTRRGYDLWAATYDATPNPVVAMDRRYALQHLQPQAGELVLDSGCGTGGHFPALFDAGASVVGLDFSEGMLGVAQQRHSDASVLCADLNQRLPLRSGIFDAVLCSLVSEHLTDLDLFFGETHRVLREGGRLVLSAFHPELAEAGVEANFKLGGIEHRLGAETHRIDDFVDAARDVRFTELHVKEYRVTTVDAGDAPETRKYLGRAVLTVIDGRT